MSRVARQLSQWLLRGAAAFVIVLALLVGVARLLLPEASRFADDVRRVAGEASGFVIDFDLLSAGVSIYGPELRLSGVSVSWPGGQEAFAAREIAIAVDLGELIAQGNVVPALVHVEGLQVEVLIDESGAVQLQNRPWGDFLRSEPRADELPELRVSLEDIDVLFADRKRGIEPVNARVEQLFGSIDAAEIELNAEFSPDPEFAGSLDIEGRVPLKVLRGEAVDPETIWFLAVAAEDFRLDPWLRLFDSGAIPLIDSEGSARAAVEFAGLAPQRINVDADISELVLAQGDSAPVRYDQIAGSLGWEQNSRGWNATGRNLRLTRDDRGWPAGDFTVRYRQTNSGINEYDADATFLRLGDVMPFLYAFAGEHLFDAGIRGAVNGDVWQFAGRIVLDADGKLQDYSLEADFQELGYDDAQAGLLLAGVSGEVSASLEGGTIQLATREATVGIDAVFRAPLAVSRLEGLALWRNSNDQLRVIANGLSVQTPYGEGKASMELITDLQFADPRIDLSATASMPDTTEVTRYLPRKVNDRVIGWLDRALESGASPRTQFRLRGPLRKFPFRDDEGQFRIDIDFRDARLRFADNWPSLERVAGQLVFENESIYTVRNQGEIAGIKFRNADARLADLREARVVIDADGPVEVGRIVRLLQRSPVAQQLGDVFADVRAEGQGEATMRFELPLRDLSEWDLQGTLDLDDASIWLTTLDPRVTDLSGRLRVDRTYVSGDGLQGTVLGESVNIRVDTNQSDGASFGHRVAVSGALPFATAEAELGLPNIGKFAGVSAFKAAAMFPAPGPGSKPFRLLLHSDLRGISSSLPYPLGKAAEERELFDAEVMFPEDGLIDVRLAFERGLLADLDFTRDSGRWALRGGRARLGTQVDTVHSEDGIAIVAYMDRFILEDWTSAFDASDAAATQSADGRRWQDLFSTAELSIDSLEVLGYRFVDTDVLATFGDNSWDMRLAGPWVEGRLDVPFLLDGSATITGELERLLLIEPLESAAVADGEYRQSPVGMPGLRVGVADFAFDDMRLGRLDASVRSTPDGLEALALNLSSPGLEIELSGDWKVVDNAQRSRLHAELDSDDMAAALERLGLAPLVEASYGRLVTDLIWEGGPADEILGGATGTLSMEIRDGVINDIDAGGGRVLGLLSIAALPRRLALDFTDLTEDKLSFSSIMADFRIDFGDAWTCNLGLEGDVADMALVGRTGLKKQDYNQVAIVRPHLSNLVPVPAAMLGGPTVGVAALLVSQIFKKPISGIGETYYTVEGDWSDSRILEVQRSELDTTPFANCETQLPDLSPEEIAAIEELLSQSEQLQPPAAEQAAPERATP